ncbi:Uncharacterised protein [Niallia circulans]|jgi:hypothetical protein|uniref:hypothetical protein n=1 Tax=Niallia TaxID=2837506 RepID=UPI000AA308E3|nr:hypothetical protein [Niallia circulans]MCM2980405.1 hypothetical protein [Niallia circulans]MED3837795.1 hypothetical protein [Niallia circulans]MED4243058.1 hypothetical protein [Niallia circulans]MED4247037.1 hypothetical protein [Niallia circulans]MED5099671.1 hypothetical protein [Niallia circulans]
MDISMTADEVMLAIQQLRSNGMNMNKKKIKQSHPDLMRHALHYFPDWNSAVEKSASA